jgi:hypothetical protein
MDTINIYLLILIVVCFLLVVWSIYVNIIKSLVEIPTLTIDDINNRSVKWHDAMNTRVFYLKLPINIYANLTNTISVAKKFFDKPYLIKNSHQMNSEYQGWWDRNDIDKNNMEQVYTKSSNPTKLINCASFNPAFTDLEAIAWDIINAVLISSKSPHKINDIKESDSFRDPFIIAFNKHKSIKTCKNKYLSTICNACETGNGTCTKVTNVHDFKMSTVISCKDTGYLSMIYSDKNNDNNENFLKFFDKRRGIFSIKPKFGTIVVKFDKLLEKVTNRFVKSLHVIETDYKVDSFTTCLYLDQSFDLPIMSFYDFYVPKETYNDELLKRKCRSSRYPNHKVINQ